MNSKNLRGLREAYSGVYASPELTEEQVWEEVETWVASLIEEGYDLSEYTWEEMYEAYIEEQGGQRGSGSNPSSGSQRAKEISNRATNQRAQLGVVKTNTGYIAKPGATSYDQNKGAEAIRLANRLNKETGLEKPKPVTPLNKPPTPILPTPATSSASTSPRPATAPARPAPTASRPAPTAAPAKPSGGQTGDKAKDMATWAASNKGLAAASAERARTRGTSATTNPLMGDMKSRMPAPSTPSPTTTSTAFSKSTPSLSKPMSSSSNYSSAKVSPSANVIGKKDQKSLASSFEWGSTSKLVDGIANAYSSIYEAKKVDQDKDGDNDFADVRVARLIASGMSKEEAIRRVKDKSYNEEVEIDEATRMRKELGKEGETATRKELASRSKAYQRSGSVDKTIAAAERRAFIAYITPKRGESAAESNARGREQSKTLRTLAANRRGSVRGREGLRGYAAKVTGGDKGLQSARSSARSAGTLTPAEKRRLGEDLELWVNELVEEGYDLSDYTWDEMAEIYEETAKEKEERIAARRARLKEIEAQGRVMTSSKRTSQTAAQRRAEKKAEALERAAEAILNQTRGPGRVSDKPMGSQTPAAKEAPPEANRRLKTGLRRDTLGTAADDALKSRK